MDNIEQKAKELVDKFMKYADRNAKPSMLSIGGRQSGINYSFADVKNNAKQCALICVGEIIKVAPLQGFDNIDSEYSFMVEDHPESFEEFWQKVKEKIQQL